MLHLPLMPPAKWEAQDVQMCVLPLQSQEHFILQAPIINSQQLPQCRYHEHGGIKPLRWTLLQIRRPELSSDWNQAVGSYIPSWGYRELTICPSSFQLLVAAGVSWLEAALFQYLPHWSRCFFILLRGIKSPVTSSSESVLFCLKSTYVTQDHPSQDPWLNYSYNIPFPHIRS